MNLHDLQTLLDYNDWARDRLGAGGWGLADVAQAFRPAWRRP